MIFQVTTGFTSAGKVLIPGQSCKQVTLQNNGTGAWRLSFDGGAAVADGFNGTDPTTTSGYLLAAATELKLTLPQYPSFGPKPIVAIFAAGGTQILDIATDDKDSTSSAHA